MPSGSYRDEGDAHGRRRWTRRGSGSIVEIPVRAIEVEFGSRPTWLSNGSGCENARQAWEAMQHAIMLAPVVGAADSAVSSLRLVVPFSRAPLLR